MNNSQASSLNELIDSNDFFENPLDVYESYTYTLEWFVVDREADIRYQEFGESLNVQTVVNDGWPGPEDVKITIAKTGVTTEFNIVDLTVDAQGAGIASSSKLAGTATYLEFSVVEVGETSLNDNLQNAVALCGWRGVDSAHYYMKINFIGVKPDGSTVKMPQTKVLTFTLQKVTRLSSTTDARGTSTVLQGTILNDTVIGNKSSVSKTEGTFTYIVGENLYDTLGVTEDTDGTPKEGSFIDELNKNTKRRHPLLVEDLQNTYRITMSKQFKELIKDSTMSGVTADTIKNMKPPMANQVGQVLPLLSIFKIIDDIVLNTLKIKEELTEDNSKRSKVYKIIPWIVPKKKGFNPITGTMAYNVEFFIDYEKNLITQNSLDETVKIKEFGTTFKELLEEQHVNKIYHYLFTGKNDQILDFNITQDQYLAKTYSVPSDWYAYQNIIKADTVEGNELLENFKNILNKSQEQQKELEKLLIKADENYQASLKSLQEYDNDTFRGSLEQAYAQTLGPQSGDRAGVLLKQLTNEFFKGKSIDQIQTEILALQGEDGSYPILADQIEERKKLKEIIEKERVKLNSQKNINKVQSESVDSQYKDYISSAVYVTGEERWNNGVKQNAQKILSGSKNKNSKNIILLEELDDDVLSKLSNDDFESIIKSQANNPIIYNSVLRASADPDFVPTIKSTDPENLALARAKYYESKGASVSMINASMVIKGDPHWLEGYLPPKVLKEEFGDVGAVSKKGYSMLTSNNGYNYLILKSGKADGTDLYDNVLKTDMLTHLYCVTAISNNFSQGLFTQTLTMVRETRFDTVTSFTPTIGPPLEEKGDKNTNLLTVDDYNRIANEKLFALAEQVEAENEASKLKARNEIEALQNNIGMNKNSELFVTKPDGSITILSSPLGAEVDKRMRNTVDSATDDLEDTVDILSSNPANPSGKLGYHQVPALDFMVRRNNALDTLENWESLGKSCASGKSPGSCTALEETRNGVLALVGLSPEDRGTPAAVTTINDYFNTALADPNATPGFAVSEAEVAMYQIAVGADLNVTGHNPADIKKITDKINLERTAEEIITEINNGTYDSKPLGFAAAAAVDSTSEKKLLTGEKPLVNDGTDGLLINIPTYTWSEKLYRDQINYPNSNNDWKTTHWFEEYVDKTVAAEKSFQTESKLLEVKPIVANSLTMEEASDVQILTDKYNRIMNDAYIKASGAHQAKEQEWLDSTVKALDEKIIEEEIVVSDDVRNAMNLKAAAQIRAASTLELVTDEEFSELEDLADAINGIVDHTVTSDRGDISDAIQVGKLQGELLTSSLKQNEINSRTYYFDPSHRLTDMISLEELETETAIASLSLPNDVTTSVAVASNSGNAEKIKIKNPVTPIATAETPILVKTASDTRDVILPGSLKDKIEGAGIGWEYAMANPDKVAQYNEALKVYKLLTDYENGTKVTVEDDNGIMHTVLDYNNLAPITYTDANGVSQTISDPSNFFGVYTMTYNDMNPSYLADYDILKEKVADLFPAIKSGLENPDISGKINADTDLVISIKHSKFYIDATSP
jgi:hypothetical protein